MPFVERKSVRLRFTALAKITAVALSLTLAATACGGESGGGETDNTITIGLPTGWAEGEAASHLWERILKDKGYRVEVKGLDVGPLFTGVAKGDIDLFLDTWLPTTHEDYWKRYNKDLEQLGVWYSNAKLTIAVPSYSPLKSLEDLKGKGGDYGGKIIGIESGSGLYRISSTKMLPDYGLKGEYTVTASSTAAMLAELKKALDAKKDIVVTLWRPHWAYAAYDIRDLEDPKGSMGGAEEISSVARKGFSKDFPDVAQWLKKFTMNDQQLGSLEDLLENKYKGDPQKAVDEWLKANPDFVSGITG